MKTKILTASILVAFAVAAPVALADAKANWDKNCAACHGKDGKGDTKMGKKSGVKDYTDAKVQSEMKDDKAFESVKKGLKDGGKELMKPFADKLSDDDIKALVAYMRTFKK